MARRRNINYIYGADLSNLEKAWKRIDRGMKRTAAQFERTGKAMTKAFTVPLVAVGTVATKAALDVDKAMQRISRGTGAQGKELDSLQREWRKLAGSVTQNFEESAQVLADFNTRLGLTGDRLRKISKQALDAARMTGEGVDNVVSQSAKAMNDWGVAAEDMSKFMDTLFKAAQSTGIQMGNLSTQLYKYGAGLRGMGFDLESSIALLAQFEKQGVNVERIMGSLSMGLGRMAREGITDAEEAFKRLMQEIQNAESVTEATRLAIEVFGSRAGPDMALAIREGRFSVEELIATLREAEGAIEQTSRETETFGEMWLRTKNKVMIAIEPIGREILNIAESVMPQVERAAERATTAIEEMSDDTKTAILAVAAVLAAGGPLLIAIGAAIKGLSALGGAFLALCSGPAAPIVLTIATVWALIDAYKNLDKIQKKITGRTPQEALDRSAYMDRAGEIYQERHGKYPATAVDYAELDAIIDELIEQEHKTRTAIDELGTEVMSNVKGTASDTVDSVKAALDSVTDSARSMWDTVADSGDSAMERVQAVGAETAAAIERMNQAQFEQTQAAEAAVAGIAKFWREMAWEFEQGFLSAGQYFEMLRAEVETLTVNTDIWRERFAELQRIAEQLAEQRLEGLIQALEDGALKTEQFRTAVESLRAEFEGLPRVQDHITQVVTAFEQSARKTSFELDSLMTKADMWSKSLADGIANAIVQGRSLIDVLRQIAAELLKMMISRALTGLFGGMFSLFHEGGVVGAPSPKTLRTMQPKRYHSGGLIGGNEELAILEKGERVIPKDSPGAVVINVFDKQELEKATYEAMAKYPGAQIVENHVLRNIRERGALAVGVKS